jgi:hypothetical protein
LVMGGGQETENKLANFIAAIDTFQGKSQGRMDFATSVRVITECDRTIPEFLKEEVRAFNSVCVLEASKCSTVITEITKMTLKYENKKHAIPYLKNCLERQVEFCADVSD